MKVRFSTLDIIALIPELKSKICTGWRVNQVYDCDYKTYLFKLNKSIVQMKKDNDPMSINEETENKMTFIIESGLRIHTTDYDWPRSHAPGQFATRLRKYIRNKRVEDIRQLGIDRIIDIQFGSNQAANHLIVELYDRGNLILTDNIYTVIAILRWRKPVTGNDKQKNDKTDFQPSQFEAQNNINLKVGDIYPCDQCRKLEDFPPLTEDKIVDLVNNYKILSSSAHTYKKKQKSKQELRKDQQDIHVKDLFMQYVPYGSSLLEDKLLKHLSQNANKQLTKSTITIKVDDRGRFEQTQVKEYSAIILSALEDANQVFLDVLHKQQSPGYIVEKRLGESNRTKADTKQDSEPKQVTTNIDFFPILSCAERKLQQDKSLQIRYLESFDKAVDVYYCNLESNKLDSKAFSAEKEVKKKLENLKIAHERKLNDLARVQKEDEERAHLIELNCEKVENALLIIRSMIANQMSWADIKKTIAQAQAMSDPIASLITGVKFDRNEFTMKLCDPYENSHNEDSEDDEDEEDYEDEENEENDDSDDSGRENKQNNKKKQSQTKYTNVDIDIGLSAFANARRFFDKRRTAVDKERKTIEVSKKAFKNVARKTNEMLKDVEVKTNITKARKRYWFENFFWFLSTDGYLVVAGRDAEQNDLLVKRYMKQNDIYVHADLHGAATVIIKNESSDLIPPKTLNEAGTMAVCYSSAWDNKIAINSWWVYPKQVSKTAPAGEYLSSGAFMIRGKKNYLPISNLVLGFGFLFRLDEESIERRKSNRLAREHTLPVTSVKPKSPDLIYRASNSKNSNPVLEEEESDSDGQNRIHDEDSSPGNSQSDENHLDANNKQSESGKNQVSDSNIREDEQSQDEDEDDEEAEEDLSKQTEHRLVDTLTEDPLADDILLYAIPMCGPYSAFQNFKYRTKVVPGANKRGKAAKTCLGLFLHDKRASQREKDLLKALKDQDYARNIPNKVKISAPNMKSVTNKKPKKSEVRLPISY